MNKSLTIVWLFLVVLTLLSVSVSSALIGYAYQSQVIIFFALIKFIGVTFYFMNLKKAHPFWKIITVVFIVLFLFLF